MEKTKVEDEVFMRLALKEAEKAFLRGEVPVGAVIVKDNKVIAKSYNMRECKRNALFHAEVLAINKACKKLNTFRLDDCQMYVTLEPCAMCSGAIINSRLKKVIIGALDNNYGCCGSKYNLVEDSAFEHICKVSTNICQKECEELLKKFFLQIRQKNKLKRLMGKDIDLTKINDRMGIYKTTEREVDVFSMDNNSQRVVAVIDFCDKIKIDLITGEKEYSADEIFNCMNKTLNLVGNFKVTTLNGEIKTYKIKNIDKKEI